MVSAFSRTVDRGNLIRYGSYMGAISSLIRVLRFSGKKHHPGIGQL